MFLFLRRRRSVRSPRTAGRLRSHAQLDDVGMATADHGRRLDGDIVHHRAPGHVGHVDAAVRVDASRQGARSRVFVHGVAADRGTPVPVPRHRRERTRTRVGARDEARRRGSVTVQ